MRYNGFTNAYLNERNDLVKKRGWQAGRTKQHRPGPRTDGEGKPQTILIHSDNSGCLIVMACIQDSVVTLNKAL